MPPDRLTTSEDPPIPILNELNITHMTLAGVNTHACIRMAAIDAYQRDIRVTITSDCFDSTDADHAHISITYLKGKIAATLNNEEVTKLLTSGWAKTVVCE